MVIDDEDLSWENWNRDPFTNESRQHVSVWEKPAP